MRVNLSLILAIAALLTIGAGCGTSQNNADMTSTGLKPTPKLTQDQIQHAWEVKHPGEKAPM